MRGGQSACIEEEKVEEVKFECAEWHKNWLWSAAEQVQRVIEIDVNGQFFSQRCCNHCVIHGKHDLLMCSIF